jgi:hypothetical protein
VTWDSGTELQERQPEWAGARMPKHRLSRSVSLDNSNDPYCSPADMLCMHMDTSACVNRPSWFVSQVWKFFAR